MLVFVAQFIELSCTGNVIERSWHFGIKVIHGSRLCTVSNNTIRDSGLAGMSLYFGNPKYGPGYGNVVQGNTILNTGAIAIRRTSDNARIGVWKTWPKRAGIELVNDSLSGNSVYDYIVADNIIYDNQKQPTCLYGIIEFYQKYGNEDEHNQEPDPSVFTNKISGNLIRGMKVADYKTTSTVSSLRKR